MKTLILHIGTYKTGTTSIQNTLYRNSKALLNQGVNYLGHSNGCGSKNGRQVFQNTLNHQELECYLKSEPEDMHVFSNECLWDSKVVRNKIIPVILNTDIYARVFVVCYIRKQSDFIESFYKQEQDFGSRWAVGLSPTSFYEVLKKKGTLDILGTLSSFEELFGRSSMVVRPYTRSQLVNKDVVDDFFSSSMLSHLEIINTKPLNQSVSSQEALLKSILHSYMKFMEESNESLKTPVEVLARQFINEFKDSFSSSLTPYIYDDHQKDEINKYFLDDNRIVEDRYNINFV